MNVKKLDVNMLRKLTLILSLLFCSSLSATPADQIVVAYDLTEIMTLDPMCTFEQLGFEYLTNTYDTLVAQRANSVGELEVQPLLCEGWVISPSGKSISFQMRDNVYFRSGRQLTAEDVAFSMHRLIRLGTGCSFALTQFGWNRDNVDDMIYASDKRTVNFAVPRDVSPDLLLACLCCCYTAIVDKKAVLAHEHNGDLGAAWLRHNYAGVGPYYLKSYRPRATLVLEKTPNYYRNIRRAQTVTMRHMPSEVGQKLALSKGDIDLTRRLTNSQARSIEAAHVQFFERPGIIYLCLNMREPAFQHPKVRRAVKHLIDYGALEAASDGCGLIHQSFLPRGVMGAYEGKPFRYDPELAKQLIKESGVEMPKELTLHASIPEYSQIIERGFAKAGINLRIVVENRRQIISRLRDCKHQIAISFWLADYGDPNSNAIMCTANFDTNSDSQLRTIPWRNAWMDPECNALTLQAMMHKDPEQRALLYKKLQNRFFEESPIIVFLQEQAVLARHVDSMNKPLSVNPAFGLLNYYDDTCSGKDS